MSTNRGRKKTIRRRGRRASVSRGGSGGAARALRSNRPLFVGTLCLVLVGWVAGRLGPLSWIPSAFLGAAVLGAWYPDRLRRIVDQHRTLAAQVQAKAQWNGAANAPLADTAALFLLALWIAFLWIAMARFPEPRLASAAAGGLWAAVGIVLRSAWIVWRRGAGWVPPDPKVVAAASSVLKTQGRDKSRWTTLVVGLVAVQAAAGQVLMAGTFGVELVSWRVDGELGSVLVALAGWEVVWMLLSHRLLPVAHRVAGMRALLGATGERDALDKD